MKAKKKETRGGVRVGAGAPTKDPELVFVTFPIRLPKWMADQLDELRTNREMSRSELVRNALRHRYADALREPKG